MQRSTWVLSCRYGVFGTGTTPTSPLFLYHFYRFTPLIHTKRHPPSTHPENTNLGKPHFFLNSALFTNKQGLTRSCNACRSTVSVCTAQPSIQSTTTMAPSVIRKAAVTCGEAPVWGMEKSKVFPLKKWFGRCLSWNGGFFGGKLSIWKHKENNKKNWCFFVLRSQWSLISQFSCRLRREIHVTWTVDQIDQVGDGSLAILLEGHASNGQTMMTCQCIKKWFCLDVYIYIYTVM